MEVRERRGEECGREGGTVSIPKVEVRRSFAFATFG